MDNSFILFLENDLIYNDLIKYLKNTITTNEIQHNNLISLVFNNYLLILFITSCFSTILCCCSRRKIILYKPISQNDIYQVNGVPI